jgi:hypothetical protein
MRAVRDYVDRYVAFSFNHYMSPQQQWGNYHRTYLQYLSTGAVDQTPPSTPSRLVARAESYNSVRLDWSPSTDNMGVAGYVVYRDNKVLRTIYLPDPDVCSGFRDHDNSIAKGTGYEYRVVAFDAAGNKSAVSASTKATTSTYDSDQAVSASKPYAVSVPASAPYADINGKGLTDGLAGDESLYDCWQGQQTDRPYTFTADLQGEFNVAEINSDWLQKKKDFVFLPQKVRYQVSLDGVTFKDVGEVSRPADNDCAMSVKYSLFNLNAVARHVRMIVEPEGGWTMTSEFQIFGTPKTDGTDFNAVAAREVNKSAPPEVCVNPPAASSLIGQVGAVCIPCHTAKLTK